MLRDKPKVLVVGTTADYVQWIRAARPGSALFLTDPVERQGAAEPHPGKEEEILADLRDAAGVRRALRRHLRRYGLTLDGIACFDCESMALAADLAVTLDLPYPTREAVCNCRDKHLSKTLWRKHGLNAPACRCVGSAAEVVEFFDSVQDACVLKPLSGSGSELIFCAHGQDQAVAHFNRIRHGLERRRDHRLYAPQAGGGPAILMEACIRGEEYSCDFMITGDKVRLIRLARKIPSPEGPFGTIMGYVLCKALPLGMAESMFFDTLLRGAQALGLQRAFCMLDFMVCDGRMVLIELTPRPGGDCLPALLRSANGLDVLSAYLDFCRQRPVRLPKPFPDNNFAGLRLHACRQGELTRIDTDRLSRDRRVCDLQMIGRVGSRVTLPPDDYTSWLLGHVVFKLDDGIEPELQCRMLLDQLEVEVR